jgi:predicted NAD/FAD-dependent oxidoreductase
MPSPHSVAIVGAGVAGLSCARELQTAGCTVKAFDKGRGPGGRLSTRRIETLLGEARFDHGAQYFTARAPGFSRLVKDLAEAGFVAPWTGRLVSIAGGQESPMVDETRWVGTPGMNGLVRGLADGVDIAWGVQVTGLSRDGTGWRLATADGTSLGHFDAVVVAIPAEQAAPLLTNVDPALSATAAAARAAPCWAGMFAFAAPLATPFDGAKLVADPVASWIACNTAKPGRTAPESWVVHASPAWSIDHLEQTPEATAPQLLDALRRILGDVPDPIWSGAHRWRYAQTTTPATVPFGLSADLTLGTCGDWHIGGRIEAAWQSGTALAEAFLAA